MKRRLALLVLVLPLLACTITFDLTPTPSTPAAAPPTATPLVPQIGGDTPAVLQQTNIPVYDPYEFTLRMEGRSIPTTLPGPAGARQVGEQDLFWVNSDRETPATLRYVTEHAYFWVETGMSYNQNDLVTLATTFETMIYPQTRALFGSEWTPGVDGDPHLYIVYTDDE